MSKKNKRKTLIFGNGLGMALDSSYFALKNGIATIFNKKYLFSSDEKGLICGFTPSSSIPESEDELDIIQTAVNSCELLSEICKKQMTKTLLNDEGEKLPKIICKFLYEVSKHFYCSNKSLPENFLKSLEQFIRKTDSHVATLNYDNLLYKPFAEKAIVSGYDSCLIDGLLDSGFHSSNLIRRYDKNFGYYLHLHGCPSFYEDSEQEIKKDSSFSQGGEYGKHIVLTHIKHKPQVIAASDILRTYWDYLNYVLYESDEIILFGYSGLDPHLNEVIQKFPKISKVVIEWKGSGKNRLDFWKSELISNEARFQDDNLIVIPMDNILEFTQWESPREALPKTS